MDHQWITAQWLREHAAHISRTAREDPGPRQLEDGFALVSDDPRNAPIPEEREHRAMLAADDQPVTWRDFAPAIIGITVLIGLLLLVT